MSPPALVNGQQQVNHLLII